MFEKTGKFYYPSETGLRKKIGPEPQVTSPKGVFVGRLGDWGNHATLSAARMIRN